MKWNGLWLCCLGICLVVGGPGWVGNRLMSAPSPQQQGKSGLAAALESHKTGDVVTASSRVYVFVGKTGLGHEHGVEGGIKSGKVSLGETRDAGSIVFDMRSFNADTPAARKYVGLSGTTSESTRKQVNANMLGSAVLDVRRFPTATFQIDSAVPAANKSRAGHPQYILSGKFTLHGVSRPIKVTAEAIASADSRTRIRGGFVIRQTDYGITPYSKAFGAIGVANELKIYGDLLVEGAVSAASK